MFGLYKRIYKFFIEYVNEVIFLCYINLIELIDDKWI